MKKRFVKSMIIGLVAVMLMGCNKSNDQNSDQQQEVQSDIPQEGDQALLVGLSNYWEDEDRNVSMTLNFTEDGQYCTVEYYSVNNERVNVPTVLEGDEAKALNDLIMGYAPKVEQSKNLYWPDSEEYPAMLVIFEFDVFYRHGNTNFQMKYDGALDKPAGYDEFIDEVIKMLGEGVNGATEDSTEEATEDTTEEDTTGDAHYTNMDPQELMAEAQKIIDDAQSFEDEKVEELNTTSPSQAEMTEASCEMREVWEQAAEQLWQMYAEQPSVSEGEADNLASKYEEQQERIVKKVERAKEESGGGSAFPAMENDIYLEAAKNKAHSICRRLEYSLATPEVIYESDDYGKCTIYWPLQDVPQQFKDYIDEKYDDQYLEDYAINNIRFMDVDNDNELEMIVGSLYYSINNILDIENGEMVVLDESGGTADMLAIAYVNNEAYLLHYDSSHGGRQAYHFYKYNGYNNLVEDFLLAAYYWDQTTYDENSEFTYKDLDITMEEFEDLRADLFMEIY